MVINGFDVCRINLDPTVGSETRKTRTCLIISPDEMNHNIGTIIVAPMATAGNDYPTRVCCTFKGKKGQVALDQIRTVDKARAIQKLGAIDPKNQLDVVSVLQQLFAS